MRDSKERFSHTTLALHWLVAITMIVLLAVGIYMEEAEVYSLYPIHKSIGILIFIPIIARVIWRLMNGWPSSLETHKPHEVVVAKVIHWVLLLGTILMPISGMLMSGAGGRGLHVFGLELLAMNPDPANPGDVIPLNGLLAGIGHEAHGIIGNILITAIVLHLVGALKHHIIDKDGTLRRMLGARI